MEINYLPVYHPNEEEQKDPKLFAQNVRQAMADVMSEYGIEATEHSYEDVILLHHAFRRHYPHPQKILLESRKLLEALNFLNLNKRNLIRNLDKFIEMDHDRTGEVTLDGFCAGMHLPNVSATAKLFAILDVNNEGHIIFREYFTGMAVLAKVLQSSVLARLFNIFTEGAAHLTESKARKTVNDLFKCLSEDQINASDEWAALVLGPMVRWPSISQH